MEKFVRLTKITDWKIDNDKKEPTATKTVYVRPCDIISFEEDEGTTVVRFIDDGRTVSCGIHVKETPEKIFEMINGKEYHPARSIPPGRKTPSAPISTPRSALHLTAFTPSITAAAATTLTSPTGIKKIRFSLTMTSGGASRSKRSGQAKMRSRN